MNRTKDNRSLLERWLQVLEGAVREGGESKVPLRGLDSPSSYPDDDYSAFLDLYYDLNRKEPKRTRTPWRCFSPRSCVEAAGQGRPKLALKLWQWAEMRCIPQQEIPYVVVRHSPNCPCVINDLDCECRVDFSVEREGWYE